MHKYNNRPYGMPVMTRTIPRADLPVEPEQRNLPSIGKIQNKPIEPVEYQKNKYLPGERLLKSLNKQNIKNKPLNTKVIKKSIEGVLNRLDLS